MRTNAGRARLRSRDGPASGQTSHSTSGSNDYPSANNVSSSGYSSEGVSSMDETGDSSEAALPGASGEEGMHTREMITVTSSSFPPMYLKPFQSSGCGMQDAGFRVQVSVRGQQCFFSSKHPSPAFALSVVGQQHN